MMFCGTLNPEGWSTKGKRDGAESRKEGDEIKVVLVLSEGLVIK